ncbi:HD domain-containing protein [Heliobacterium gestii]|uniref:HD domain-containing protein n=1 Tax=Heliomicrobium gestii TaxID=2699 RepID=A0A845LAS3_HELGE|nr:HD domain-containing phosphohydrolase [Heliomicrobium gestii]MBM7865784.1 HD-GYP domain-containing protein (c-di-GMP phosphodiesterase class II) [Heliomicrobium gestii]MZP42030.1 HD domain-containing protein [Heliomicrobium gestii]
MRITSVSNLKIGDVLAKNIYASDGRILLSKDVSLTGSYITRLRNLGISKVYIQDASLADVSIDEPLTDQTRNAAIQILDDITDTIPIKTDGLMTLSNDELNRISKKFDSTRYIGVVREIVTELVGKTEVMVHLADMREKSDFLFTHSITTTVMSTLCGLGMNLSRKQLDELAIGCLLHDIGFTIIEPELLRKPITTITAKEAELFRKHTVVGLAVMRKLPGISIPSAIMTYQHHEMLDGSGFPCQRKGDQIHLYSRILAVADFFDNLISGKAGKTLLPHQAYEVVIAQSGRKFDHNVVSSFVRHIALYPNGCTVLLTTNETGVVVRQTASPARPVVRVFQKRLGNEVDFKEYDMTKELTIFIKEVID